MIQSSKETTVEDQSAKDVPQDLPPPLFLSSRELDRLEFFSKSDGSFGQSIIEDNIPILIQMARRYEYLRVMTPNAYSKLYMEASKGNLPFDTVIDMKVEERRKR